MALYCTRQFAVLVKTAIIFIQSFLENYMTDAEYALRYAMSRVNIGYDVGAGDSKTVTYIIDSTSRVIIEVNETT
jgi:hypothetical protein